ncbi:nuclear transport factor 2 family protein [Streptomyces palmae]|uniref:Nuclear transport factor 2 family protein n=2 Tax=Streptomyces palmae TaxID=1701085 RepID=A0A4Z0GKR6_9ACTN|nr:nuclear transport factor 2 family protein [Streptomyces palmae]
MSVLTGMYAAEARYLAAGGPGQASFDILAPYFGPDMVLHQAEGLPYAGTWHGHDGLARFFLAMSETWERFDMVEQEFLTVSEVAVVETLVRARARATGRELALSILQTIAIRDGRIREVRPFYWDTAAVRAACGLGPMAGGG